ncbi:MAG: metallophosphoesterase family protein [Dehalococcoidia bacterium]|nr:metallophosphoesterase family protein [Dehalococcoidia bacterium]
MKVALIADVHANLPALEAVLREVDRAGAEAVWSMGDQVGYGGDPGAVIARLIDAGASCVLGNHDAAAAGLIGTEEFNHLAATAAAWTASVLGESTRAWLRGLPPVAESDGWQRAHGTLHDPTREYLSTMRAAEHHFAVQTARWSAAGHTHIPMVVWEDGDGFAITAPDDGATVALDERRACVNPGSVGQPRDGDTRASWALLDTAAGEVTFHRVAYDIGAAQARIRAAGLPEALALRLARGR